MTERISEAIDILLDAVNNRTLAKGICSACAVGNLIAAGLCEKVYCGSEYKEYYCNKDNTSWKYLFITNFNGVQEINEEELNDKQIMKLINATKFTWKELALIENTFERNTSIYYDKYSKYTKKEILQDQIKGLEAVVQVMLDFDNCINNVYEIFTSKVTV